MMKTRITWIDVARGIGILLVLYGHELTADSWRYVLYAFHMPLFFFLSGIVFHHRKYEKYSTILWKSIRGILIPYFIFATTTYAFSLLFIDHGDLSQKQIHHQLFGILYGNGNNDYLSFNVVLWFLPCLFVCKLSFAFLTNFVRSTKGIALSLFGISLIGYLFSTQYPTYKLLFGIESALTGIVFFGLGYLWNTHQELLTRKVKQHLWPTIILSSLLCIAVATLDYRLSGQQIDMRLNHLNNYFLLYVGAITGILTIIAISIRINTNWILEHLGRLSLIIFAWHTLVYEVFNKILFPNDGSSMTYLQQNLFLTPAYMLVAAYVIVGINWITHTLFHTIRRPSQ